jgi:dTDP-4-dehydrorhamnose reductase
VFNAAAWNAVDRAETEEALAHAVNALGVGHLASAARENGALLAHISSDYVFDGLSSSPIPPHAPLAPLSAYGRSKASGEQAAGPDALIVRSGWLHAAGHANFVTTMLRLMRSRAGLKVVADQTGCPTWAQGLAQVLWALAQRDARGIWHHRDGGTATWHQFATAIGEEALALGLIPRLIPIEPITTAVYAAPAPRPIWSVLDDSATRAFLGDRAAGWRDTLRMMLKEEAQLG